MSVSNSFSSYLVRFCGDILGSTSIRILWVLISSFCKHSLTTVLHSIAVVVLGFFSTLVAAMLVFVASLLRCDCVAIQEELSVSC